ncbi:hypothetical protein SNE40_010514 [Patella caerulea]|uniref:Gamma-butyrobetaine hydroxylase-like N-terminal domain-containing protein n=1 Tax=Patella caerulea TaxID=87958 RepID=A0AAN8K1Y6_PATCE
MKLQPLGNTRKLFQNLWQIKAANDIGWNCHSTRFYSFRHRISGVQSLFDRSLILPTGTRKECTNHFNRKYRNFQNLCFRQLQTSQTEVKQPVKATLQQDGKIVAIDWSKDESSKFHSVWLRHNCQCRRCIQEGSGQRIFDSSEISHELNLQSIEVKDSVVHFKWSDVSNHDGEISLDYLQTNCYSPSSIKNRYSAVQINKLAKEIPVVNYTDVVKKKEELYRWLHLVNEYGICLLKDVPAEDKAVLAVADLIGPIQETNYGKASIYTYIDSFCLFVKRLN